MAAVRDVLSGINAAIMVDDYPNHAKGRCVLVLQRDAKGCKGKPYPCCLGHSKGGILPGGGSHWLQAGPASLVGRFSEEKTVKRRHHIKLVHEGDYVAAVDIELMYTDEGWSPYLSLADAQKLDGIRDALRKGDLRQAAQLARVYTLTPVAL